MRARQVQEAGSLAPPVAESAAYPVLRSPRFRFRPFAYSDIEQLSALANQHRIADSTVGIPHPYTTEFARMWIASHSALWVHHRALHWAALEINNIDNRHILGYVGLSKIDIERKQAELRFWVGCGAQRKEYATEWCATVLQFASASLDVTRVYALQIARHPLAGRVLAGLGMRPEGHVRKRAHKEGLIEDIVCWELVRNEREPKHRQTHTCVDTYYCADAADALSTCDRPS